MKTLSIALTLLATCNPQPTPVTPPQPVQDAGITVLDAAPGFQPDASNTTCGQACAVLQWLGCPEGDPTPRGESCASVCEKVRLFPNFALPTACVIDARTIDAARRCGPQVRCPIK